MRSLAISLLFIASIARADVSGCACDPEKAETMEVRQCSLCREAERHPTDTPSFFLKDNNPRKPNRWLLLPRTHKYDGMTPLASMTRRERTELWTKAIDKARSLWGDEWGIAINGDKVRTQCHSHVHIGRLLKGIETRNFIVVRGPADIPVPENGQGLWIHPQGKKLHVHLGEQTTETVLLR